ncbi:hypothetical protein SAMN05421820_107177 [Pedobacter steynii]|uniref:Uncharacterized protein n=1 Tax=Pedobacter steynii TaxID=430522 RepID=A0A1H0ARM9_9SPHI|nr:hypothetical protein SAMN05421820_107177 [Pedobacter steynii]
MGYGGEAAYEYGTIETDKGWLQRYQTVYSVAGVGFSGGSTGGAILPIGNNKPTFSDWRGLAMGNLLAIYFSAQQLLKVPPTLQLALVLDWAMVLRVIGMTPSHTHGPF